MKNFLLLLSITCLYGCGEVATTEKNPLETDTAQLIESSKNKPAQSTARILYPVEAKSVHEYPQEDDSLFVNLNGYRYSLSTESGEITEKSIDGSSTKNFKIQTDGFINNIYLLHYEINLLVYHCDTDGEDGVSFIELLDRKTGESIFWSHIPGFNLGQPIVVGGKSYVTTIGFVGKIDLLTGKYDWQYDDLYDHQKYSFNSFDSISVDNDTVQFISEHYRTKTIDKVFVADKSGKLLQILK
jgi:hypothetical protein